MSIWHFSEGDWTECPHCGKEFHLVFIDAVEWDDFDKFYEHVSICDG